MKLVLLVFVAVAFSLLVWSGCGLKKETPVFAVTVRSDQAPAPIGPYSQAVKFGRLTFLSGQIALDQTGKLDTSSIEAETHQVMKNLQAVLKAGELDFDQVVKTTIYLSDLRFFKQVNEIYGSYFSIGKFPARETIEVSSLPKGARIEISMIAAN
jgi:2-iminobutanoate/2-iminopropanoate deaminase